MGFETSKVGPQSENLSQIQQSINGQINSCRICLQTSGNMIKPCSCTGSIQFVHQKCMILWISSLLKYTTDTKICCQICKQQIKYEIQQNYTCKPKNCLKNIDKISSCSLIAVMILLIVIVILSIVLKYSNQSLLSQAGKIAIILVLSITCISIFILIIFILKDALMEKTAVILKVYDKHRINNTKQPSSQQSFVSKPIAFINF